jgi:hypothetical protein
VLLSAALVLPALAGPQAQLHSSSGGFILGRVIEGDDERPVPDVLVQLSGGDAIRRVLTDQGGRFAFENVEAGSHRLVAGRQGFIPGEFGKLWPSLSGRPVELEPGAEMDDLEIRIWRYATIGGTVRNPLGEPLVGVTVRALAASASSGRQVLSFDTPTCGGSACLLERTDDRGQYRFLVFPGTYVMAVPVVAQSFPVAPHTAGNLPPPAGTLAWLGGGARFSGPGMAVSKSHFLLRDDERAPPIAPIAGHDLWLYQTQYFSMATDIAQATPLVVSSGDVRTGVDFSLAPARAASVEGIVHHEGSPVPGIVVRLVPQPTIATAFDLETAVTMTDSSGGFLFHGVIPGQYLARTSLVGTPALWGDVAVSVGQDHVSRLLVDLSPMAHIGGQIEFEGQMPSPADASTSILIERADGRRDTGISRVAVVDEAWRFRSAGQPPGRYRVRLLGAPEGWRVESMRLGGRDVLLEPVDIGREDLTDLTIVLTAEPAAAVTGLVRDLRFRGVEAVVVAFPADTQSWTISGVHDPRFLQVGSGPDGRYMMPDVPAGEYYLAALSASEDVLWREQSYLESLVSRAIEVTIKRGERRVVDLELSGTS